MKKRKQFPVIGARIIKSAVSVFLCMIIYYIRTLTPAGNGIPFYSALAALWCMQPYPDTTIQMARQRSAGTIIGAAYGLLFLIIMNMIGISSQILIYTVSSAVLIPVLYTTVILNKKNASFFSCVVFLSITLTHSFDENPYLFVLNRILDTFIGIAVGIGVNDFRLPSKHDNNTLYVSGIDSVLISENPYAVPYSKVELNRLIDEGMKFTISTIHTPTELIQIMNGVKLKLPVIVMDGAALYDLNDNSYYEAELLDRTISSEAERIISECGYHSFISTLYDHTLLEYYSEPENEAEIRYFEQQKRSPYCNSIHNSFRRSLSEEKILYLTVIIRNESTDELKRKLKEKLDGKIRITVSESEYEGFSFLKVYSPLVSKKRMIEKLKRLTSSENAVTFGSIRGAYDVYIKDGGGNHTVKMLKKMYKSRKSQGK